MAVVKHRRGVKAHIPATGLSDGELLIATDTHEAFFANITGNPVPFKVDVANLIGSPNRTYTHAQAIPEAVWTITHDLVGKYPSVSVVDSAGSLVIGEVHYVGTNQVVLNFSSAFSGIAYLN
jgi:hypothetical protein